MQENSQEKSPVKLRILQYIDFKGLTKYAFYKESGITRGILDQNTGISEDNLMRFIDYARDISLDWLLHGKGSMINKKPVSTNVPPVSIQNKKNILKNYSQKDYKGSHFTDAKGNYKVESERWNYIPIVDRPVYEEEELKKMGVEIENDSENFIRFPFSILKGGVYNCIRVRDTSMEPILCPGDYVIIRLLDRDRWAGEIKNDFIYGIYTNSKCFYLRRIQNYSEARVNIIGISESEEKNRYPDLIIDQKDILNLWSIEWHISYAHNDPRYDYKSKLEKLEGDVLRIKNIVGLKE